MPNVFSTKFVELLCKISEEEFKSFEKWLASPWCNSNKNLVTLLRKLKKHHPNYDDPKLTKERLFKKVMPGKTHSKTWMNNLLSEANIQLEKFLIHQSLQTDEGQRQHYLTQQLQDRHIENRFFKTADAAIQKLEEKDVKNWEDYIDLLKFHRRIYHHPNQNPRMKPGSPTIVEMDENLETAYLLEKAVIINEKIFRNRILKGEQHEVSSEIKIWRMLAEKSDHASVLLFKMRFDYEPDNLLAIFQKLKMQYFNTESNLNLKDRKIHLASLINDFKHLRSKGLLNIVDSLPLFKVGLETGILLHNGIITNATFVSILSASNAAKDFDFSRFFTKKYSGMLDETARADGKVFGDAHTLNKEGKFEEALDVLNSHEFESPYFQLTGKMTTLQVYFELLLRDASYETLFYNFADAFEKWIYRRRNFSKANLSSFTRFVQKTTSLMKLFLDITFDESKLERLLNDKTNTQGINWFLNKGEQIRQVKKK